MLNGKPTIVLFMDEMMKKTLNKQVNISVKVEFVLA